MMGQVNPARIRRKKEDGFTLIELMIVIAVIGILAVVLIPKVGTIKTQAKAAGVDTNMRMVEGYVQSRISTWANTKASSTVIANDLISAFSGEDQLTNPFTSAKTIPVFDNANAANQALIIMDNGATTLDGNNNVASVADYSVTDASHTKGSIVASVNVNGSNVVQAVSLYAHGVDGEVLSDKTVTVLP